MTFKKWFDDMQHRYQECYDGYEDLLQEAFEAGAKQEREACAREIEHVLYGQEGCGKAANAIRTRG